MARPRVIDQDSILDAAERIVARDGAANLTLEAVGIEAGISKGSVVYDYKTKQALIRAIVERRTDRERGQLEELLQKHGERPNAAIRACVDLARNPPEKDALAVSMNLCAALAQDTEIRASLRSLFDEDLKFIEETSPNPRTAVVAFLAIQGLRSLEFFGIREWTEEERSRIIGDIDALTAIDLVGGSQGD